MNHTRSSRTQRSVVLFTVAMVARVGMTILGAGALTMVGTSGAGAATTPAKANLVKTLTGKAALSQLAAKPTAKANGPAVPAAAPDTDGFACRASLARLEIPPGSTALEPFVANDVPDGVPCTGEDASVVGNVDLTPLGDVTLLQVVTTQDRH